MQLFQRLQLTKAVSCNDTTYPAHHELEEVKSTVMINSVIIIIIINIMIVVNTTSTAAAAAAATVVVICRCLLLLLLSLLHYFYCSYCHAELNTGVMLMRNTDWSQQFIGDVARLGRMHVNHWQLMDEVMHRQAIRLFKLQYYLLLDQSLTVAMKTCTLMHLPVQLQSSLRSCDIVPAFDRVSSSITQGTKQFSYKPQLANV